MIVQQRLSSESARRQALVTFLDAGEVTDGPVPDQEPTSEVLRLVREELRQAQRRMEIMRDDYYVTNEDLRAANEELQSLNEEYRSTTEELETSKEELQSVNEELQTVNQELKQKLEEVSRTNSDLENLMAATNLATLFVDRDCRISRFTPRLSEIFNIKSRDLGRPIGDITHSLDYTELESDARKILSGSEIFEREVRSREGRAYIVRLSPYRRVPSGEIDGAVVTFFDVTGRSLKT
jgi:two-component system CheB/CheR fusion protein